MPVTPETHRGHNFDEDAVCTDCGFDGAEWSHWRHHTWEGKASPDAKPPLCTHLGRPRDVYPPRDDEPDDDCPDDDCPDEPECERCHGDGCDPWCDYLLPCPDCQGEQTP